MRLRLRLRLRVDVFVRVFVIVIVHEDDHAREGVAHAWLIDPIARRLEAYTLGAGGRWSKPEIHEGAARVRLAPFDAIELDLSALWA